MPSQKFKLEVGGPERLELRWSGIFNQTEVLFDTQVVGSFIDKAGLEQGHRAILPDGSELWLKLDKSFGGGGLQVLRNGVPVPGSATDPATVVKNAAGIVYFIAGLNVVVGVVAMAGVEFLQRLGMGVYNIVFGLVYFALGFFTGRGSRIALGAAMAIFALDAVLGLVAGVQGGQTPGAGIAMRGFIIFTMWKAFALMGEVTRPAPPAQPYR